MCLIPVTFWNRESNNFCKQTIIMLSWLRKWRKVAVIPEKGSGVHSQFGVKRYQSDQIYSQKSSKN